MPEFILGTPLAPKGDLGLDREPNAPSFALPRRCVSGVAVNAGMAKILVCAPRKSSKIKIKMGWVNASEGAIALRTS